jgi:lipid II:glycine glycyltransferase (peptidoglycan interpeptide bridge formation enzyme)
LKLKQLENIKEYCSLAEPELGIFSSYEWLSIYGSDLSVIGIYNDDEKLVGGFYYLDTRKAGFKFIKLPPYTPHCGLYSEHEAKKKYSINGYSKEVVNEVCQHIKSNNPALAILAFPSQVVDMQPFIWNKFKVIPNYTYRIDLRAPIEDIRGNFDPKNRNIISKALKENLMLTLNKLKGNELYEFFSNSLNSAGANVYEAELQKIFNAFSEEKNSFSFEAWKGEELAGAVFCIYDRRSCYYLLGGTNKKSQVNGLNNLLIQKSIEKAKELGCITFDFEGSMLKGVEKFFRSFGGDLVPYYTINKGKLPLEMLLKFKKRELF